MCNGKEDMMQTGATVLWMLYKRNCVTENTIQQSVSY